jgi:hypothetical protein
MVIFQTPEGSPGYKQFESLDEAVGFVEELRNERGVTNARMFALEEIKFELKPVFKVEVQALTAGSAAAPPPAAPAAPAPAGPAPVAPAPAPQIHAQPVAPAEPAPPPPGGAPASQEQAAPEAPAPAAAEPPKEQPARRGLFGR